MRETNNRNNSENMDNIYEDNKFISMAVNLIYEEQDKNAFATLLDVLLKRLLDDGEAPAPMVDKNHVMDSISLESLGVGDTFTLNENLKLTIDKMRDSEGNIWVPLYTDYDEIDKGNTTNIRINLHILTILEEACCYEESQGLVINPFGQSFTVPKEVVKVVLEEYAKRMATE